MVAGAGTMLAAVAHEPGGPDVLRLERRAIPQPASGEVLVRVMAFGISRWDIMARRGLVHDIRFPRVLGLDLAGVVAAAPAGEFRKGEAVASAMGGLGRGFDGSYAEYACVPATQLVPIPADLPWPVLGAAPETLHTAWGALSRSLQVERGDRLLIRGGATPVGLAALGIATRRGAIVCATIPSCADAALLRRRGARHVIVDNGAIARHVVAVFPRGMDKVLELVGPATLADSLRCARKRGIVCLAGMLGSRTEFADFDPAAVIPTAVNLTTFDAPSEDFVLTPLDDLLGTVAAGTLHIQADQVFPLERIVEAHAAMEASHGLAKIVVMPGSPATDTINAVEGERDNAGAPQDDEGRGDRRVRRPEAITPHDTPVPRPRGGGLLVKLALPAWAGGTPDHFVEGSPAPG